MTFFHSGLFDLSFWQLVGVALVFTHITIVGVTVYLHRHQAHRALELHAIPSHFFRFWLWMTTGMVTKEWAAIHRKHHAKCETIEDPHSPQIHGINKVLWGGVVLYVKESRVKETMERYGHGTPDDWMERNVYSAHGKLGVTLMAFIDIALFGVGPGMAVWGVQVAWIPFWAAGVINGWGHWFGYRNFKVADASVNIIPWGIIIGGEELHNNHHAYGTSAKLSNKWYEFDIGWMYIRIMEMMGWAKVKKIAPKPKFITAKSVCDMDTLHAVIANRYDVMQRYGKSLKRTWRAEVPALKDKVYSQDEIRTARRALHKLAEELHAADKATLDRVLGESAVMAKVYAMREELSRLWERSTASSEQLLHDLQDWCARAEASGIHALEEFSLRLRSYAMPAVAA
ncbi:MAG TPA: fatty acid desaturase [Burkholderiales bacterium]|jgi:stearoyl-CoA desaturase (delta-9 desaturase)|nr:fatty acid desaturase [Burkholderiales bacterium]